jgi:threonine dehydrogenase-like Zn-dependent dehydrogenase
VFKKTSFHEALFLHNLNTVVYALVKNRFRPGDTMLKVGAGTMGLLLVEVAKPAGPPLVVIIDNASNRLELAKEPGADVDRTRSGPADVPRIGEVIPMSSMHGHCPSHEREFFRRTPLLF